MSSIFDPIEKHIEKVHLALPITPDWLERECEFTFVQFVVSVVDGGSLKMYIHEHSNVKIYMFLPRSSSTHWTIKVYNNNLLCHHQYISTRRDFMNVITRLNLL